MKKCYIVIFEDGVIKQTDKVCEEDLRSCDDALLDLIDISGEEPLMYVEGEWLPVEKLIGGSYD